MYPGMQKPFSSWFSSILSANSISKNYHITLLWYHSDERIASKFVVLAYQPNTNDVTSFLRFSEFCNIILLLFAKIFLEWPWAQIVQYKMTSFNDKTFEKYTWFITLIKKISPSVVFFVHFIYYVREKQLINDNTFGTFTS